MKEDIGEVISLLNRILSGEEVTFEEVQSLQWHVTPEHDPLLQRIYRQLQIFASDSDIREKDAEYKSSWLHALSKDREKLLTANIDWNLARRDVQKPRAD